jgi:riboflavin transporter FmnP
MKLRLRDLVATLLVAAIAVPYVGYLLNGEMPFVQDPRGMSAIGLVLGVAAYLIFRSGNAHDRVGLAENVVAVVALALGLVALAFAEAAAAELLLALFMGSIAVVLVLELTDHAGLLPVHSGHAHA